MAFHKNKCQMDTSYLYGESPTTGNHYATAKIREEMFVGNYRGYYDKTKYGKLYDEKKKAKQVLSDMFLLSSEVKQAIDNATTVNEIDRIRRKAIFSM